LATRAVALASTFGPARSVFDPGAQWKCRQSIPARVAPKVARNTCDLFHPTVRVERETGSAAPSDARKAFDDLFK